MKVRERRGNRDTTRDGVALSGWLFADLMLALGLVFLAATPGGVALASASPTPTSSTSRLASPSVYPTPTPAASPSCVNAVGLDHVVTKIVGPGAPGLPPTASQLRQAFGSFGGKRIGLVLALGYTGTGSPTVGIRFAQEGVANLRATLPELFTSHTQEQDTAYLGGQDGKVEFMVYFISSLCDA
jgi:hypothetical protein